MRSYCVKQKQQTECQPGSEQYVKTRNGRNAMKCKCSECGITKFRFIKGTAGKKGKGLLLGRNSPFNKIPITGAILQLGIVYVLTYCVRQRKKT